MTVFCNTIIVYCSTTTATYYIIVFTYNTIGCGLEAGRQEETQNFVWRSVCSLIGAPASSHSATTATITTITTTSTTLLVMPVIALQGRSRRRTTDRSVNLSSGHFFERE
jgi:hypothetical protein